jgi:hypothetical protein
MIDEDKKEESRKLKDEVEDEIDKKIKTYDTSRSRQYRKFIFNHRKILLILLWGVTGFGTAVALPSISQWLTDAGITTEPKTVQFVLSNTNNWTDHKVVSINNPANISLLAKQHNFDSHVYNLPNVIHVELSPKDSPKTMTIEINGSGLAKQYDWTYNGQIELYRNNGTFVDKVDVDIKILTKKEPGKHVEPVADIKT